MIFIVLLSAIAVVLLVVTEPEMIEARAHTPKDLLDKPSFAKSFSLSRNVIVKVCGPSAEHLNIPNGSKVKARKLTDSERELLGADDIVVIKSASSNGSNPYRLREIEKVEGGQLYFKTPPMSEYPTLKVRDLDSAFAKVTHRAA